MYNQKERDLLFYSALRELVSRVSAADGLPQNGLYGECRISVERRRCRLDDELFSGIDIRMPRVIKAVDEMRSLINSEGEVVRIDRAKRPTKESVRHLAQHSDLFGADPLNDDGVPVPEEIYIVENTDNYAVYENRFLFALLSYLRDFLSKILRDIERETGNEYLEMTVKNREKTGNSECIRESRFIERGSALDIYSDTESPAVRISALLGTVSSLLSGALMTEVAKAPLLRPPFVRTNIIKNNINFSTALELYTLVASYTGDGYTVETDRRDISAPEGVGAMLDCLYAGERLAAEASAFGLLPMFAEAYRRRADEARAEAVRRRKEEIERLRGEMKKRNVSPEEFILLLEKQISDLTDETEASALNLAVAEKNLSDCRSELESAKTEAEKERLRAEECAKSAETAYAECEKRLADGHEENRRRLDEAERAASERLAEAGRECDKKLDAAKAEVDARIAAAEEKWNEERSLLAGTLKANRLKNGEDVGSDDYSSRDSFIILENEYSAMTKHFKAQWKLAKADIRRREKERGKTMNSSGLTGERNGDSNESDK